MPNGKMRYNYVSQKTLEERGYTYNEEDKRYWKDSYSYNPEPNANWAFDENNMTLSMYTDDGYYTYTLTITMSDDHNSFSGVTSKGTTYTFVKADK